MHALVSWVRNPLLPHRSEKPTDSSPAGASPSPTGSGAVTPTFIDFPSRLAPLPILADFPDDTVSISYVEYNQKEAGKKTLILLTGLGSNAHTFDEFALKFTDRFHVIAMTRRGFGFSTLSDASVADNYSVARRTSDLVRFIRYLTNSQIIDLNPFVLAGHSIAGDELVELATLQNTNNHGSPYGWPIPKIDALVFLDSVFDRSISYPWPDIPWDKTVLPPAVDAIVNPWPTAEDCYSLRTLTDWSNKVDPMLTLELQTVGQWNWVVEGTWYDDLGIIQNYPDILRKAVNDGHDVVDTIFEESAAYTPSWKEIGSIPVMSLIPDHDNVYVDTPYLGDWDMVAAQTAATIDYVTSWDSVVTFHERAQNWFHLARFKAELPHANIVTILSTDHGLYLSNPGATSNAMRDFLLGLS